MPWRSLRALAWDIGGTGELLVVKVDIVEHVESSSVMGREDTGGIPSFWSKLGRMLSHPLKVADGDGGWSQFWKGKGASSSILA